MNADFHLIDNVAAAVEMLGLRRMTSCVKSYYMDCRCPDTISRIAAFVHGKPVFSDVTAVVIGEELCC